MPTKGIRGDELAKEVLRIYDRLEPSFRKEFLDEVENISRSKELRKLLREIEEGDFTATSAISSRLSKMVFATEKLDTITRKAMATAARVTGKTVSRVEIDFNITNPQVVQVARTMSIELSTNLTKTTQEVLRKIIQQSVEGELTYSQAARKIRVHVGLLPAHSDAVDRYYDTLVQSGMRRSLAQKEAEKYAARLLKYRSETIARTEIARAVGEGQRAMWKQMVAENYLPTDAKRVWIVTRDERTCDLCAPMAGIEADVDGYWDTPRGPVDIPNSIHPRCRCSSGIVFPKKAGIGAGKTRLSKVDELEYEHWIFKHLSGKHNQASHAGSRKGGAASPIDSVRTYKNKSVTVIDGDYPDSISSLPKSVSSSEAEGFAKKIFDATFETEKGTLRSVVTLAYDESESYGERNVVTVNGEIRDAYGSTLGEFRRTIHGEKGFVYNAYFELNKTLQGSGIGTAIASHWEDQYARAGIKEMRVSATTDGSQMNGAYTWAVYGYKPVQKDVATVFEKFMTAVTAKGAHSTDTWSVREKMLSSNKIDPSVDDADFGRAMAKVYKTDFLRAMADYPLFKDFMKGSFYSPYVGNVSWFGKKTPKKISKADNSVLDVVERWMREKPAELENDDPRFWQEIRAVYDSEVEKHLAGKHDQKMHGARKGGVAAGASKITAENISGGVFLTGDQLRYMVGSSAGALPSLRGTSPEDVFDYLGSNSGVMKRYLSQRLGSALEDLSDAEMLEAISGVAGLSNSADFGGRVGGRPVLSAPKRIDQTVIPDSDDKFLRDSDKLVFSSFVGAGSLLESARAYVRDLDTGTPAAKKDPVLQAAKSLVDTANKNIGRTTDSVIEWVNDEKNSASLALLRSGAAVKMVELGGQSNGLEVLEKGGYTLSYTLYGGASSYYSGLWTLSHISSPYLAANNAKSIDRITPTRRAGGDMTIKVKSSELGKVSILDRENLVSAVLQGWAYSSGSQLSNASSLIAQDIFRTSGKFSPDDVIPNISNGTNKALRKVIGKMYEDTQAMYKDLGVEYVTSYRGYRVDLNKPASQRLENNRPVSVKNLESRPLSSWSHSSIVAQQFAGYGETYNPYVGAVMTRVVPVKRVLSTSVTGFGSAVEFEVVTLPPTRSEKVVALKSDIKFGNKVRQVLGSLGVPESRISDFIPDEYERDFVESI